MSVLREILGNDYWPFMAPQQTIPSGVISDIHIMDSYASVVLTDFILKGGALFMSIIATYGDLTITLQAEDTDVRDDGWCLLYDSDGVPHGRVLLGDVGQDVVVTGAQLELDRRILSPGASATMDAPATYSTDRYSFRGDEGIVLSLDQDTNIVHFSTDPGVYAEGRVVESVELRSDLDAGISAVGSVRTDALWLEIEGYEWTLSPRDNALIFTYSPTDEDWPGCTEDTVYADNILCSNKSGSAQPYPLDVYFCEGAEGCKYPWELNRQ